MDFYNFFSFSSKKAIYRASEFCQQFSNQYLEPEHIFFAILNLRSCSAVQVLHQLQVHLPKLTYSLEAYLYERAGSYRGQASFSARTLALLDGSFKEVKRLHHREIGTTHLLVALAQDRSSFLHSLFEDHQVDDRKIRDTFMTHLKGHSQGVPEQQTKPATELEASTSVEHGVPLPGAFDPQCVEVLDNAAYYAQIFNNSQVEPDHILYSIVSRRPGGAFNRDTRRNYNVAGVITYLLERINLIKPFEAEAQRWCSFRTENILQLALRWAMHDQLTSVPFTYLLAALASNLSRNQASELKKLGLVIPDNGISARFKASPAAAAAPEETASQEIDAEASCEPEAEGQQDGQPPKDDEDEQEPDEAGTVQA